MLHRSTPAALSTALGLTIASIACGSERISAPPPPAVVDSAAPVVLFLIAPYEGGQPGEDAILRVKARDAVGITTLAVSVSGSFEISGSFVLEDAPKEMELEITIPIPEGASVTEKAVARVTVGDKAGHTSQAFTDLLVIDTRRPIPFLDFGGLRSDGSVRVGDRLDVYVNAADNQGLKWIGYDAAGQRDSVPATSIGDSHAFPVTVPVEWLLKRPLMFAWARDASGNVSSGSNASHKTVPVYNWAEHPTRMVVLEENRDPHVLWDPRRKVLYRLRPWFDAVENGNWIDVIDIAATAEPQRIFLPDYTHRMAFSPSGDSLVVTFLVDNALGIIDLIPTDRTVRKVVLPPQPEGVRRPSAIQSIGGRLFVALVNGQSDAQMLEVNLATNDHAVRTDMVGSPSFQVTPNLLPLPDGRLFLGPDDEQAYLREKYIYSPAGDSFTPTTKLRGAPEPLTSVSPSGRFLLGDVVYNATLDVVARVAATDWSDYYAPVGALSHDGAAVFLSTAYGYEKVRLSDGMILEQVKLPAPPLRMIALPDGSALLVITSERLLIVTLTDD